MLNTSVWTTATGNARTLHAETLMQDFEEDLCPDPIPAMGLANGHESLPHKPYVYGRQAHKAATLIQKWNADHPFDPAPL